MTPLLLTLGRGALTGLTKRPGTHSALTPRRLTREGVRIDAATVAAYAKVCGFTSGATTPGARPGPASDGSRRADAEVPLTYPHVLGFPLAAALMAARDFPLPLLGLVHTSLAIRALRPLTAADRPDLTVRTEELRPHRRGTEVVIVTEAHLTGELVWQDVSTYLARHRVDGSPAPTASPLADAAQLPTLARWDLPASLGREHARVTGDYNPIHLHALTARPFGFPRAIAHGMWTAARCAAEHPAATSLRVTFHHPVLLPSTVEYAAAQGSFALRTGERVHVLGAAN